MLKTTASNPFLKIAAPLSATFPSKPVNSDLDKAYTRPSPVHLHNSQLNTGYILPSYSLHERYPKGNGCTHLERHGSAPGIEMGFGWEQSSVDSFWSLPCEPQTFHACNPNFYGYLRQKRRQISESHCLALSRASMITAFQLSSTQVLNESQLVERSQIPTN